MRPFGSSRSTRQKDRLGATPELAEPTPLFSWAGVEDHLATHDGSEMDDYADDIDTLLVFAGLFSAILTAFITQTYPSLQPNGTATTNGLLALSLRAQLQTTASHLLDTLDPILISHAASISPTPFTPASSDRWINIFFFLSLLFSLAAALFGILAKQWLREYMKWNSPLNNPRDNVLIRQIRIEAWDTWRVAAIISSIPILLEFGMFLFLAGVVILLWTLDDVVAKVITVFAALFTSIICAFTLLPIFSKRCPYRSPTAWAFLAAARALYASFDFGYGLFKLAGTFMLESVLYFAAFSVGLGQRTWDYDICHDVYEKHLARFHWMVPSGWRDQDLERCFATTVRLGLWSKPIDLREAARHELLKEKARFLRDGESQDVLGAPSTLDQAAEALLHNISAASRLLRALSWVRQSSEDAIVSTYVDQCISSIHSDSLQPLGESLAEWDDHIRMLTDWCLLTSVEHDHAPSEPYRALLADTSRDKAGEFTELRRYSGVHVSDNGNLSILCHRLRSSKTSVSRSSLLLIPSITQLSIADLRHFSDIAAKESRALNTRVARQRALELFSSLSLLPNTLEDKRLWELLLEAIGQFEGERPPVITAVSSDIFMLAVRYGKVLIPAARNGIVFEPEGPMTPADFEPLLIYFISKLEGGSESYLDLAILTSFYWLRSGGVKSAGFSASAVLDKMIVAARTISSFSRPKNSASRDRKDLLWISELSLRSYALTVFHGSRFRELLHTLGQAFRRDQLVGPQDKIHTHLHDALLAAHAERPCDHMILCPWNKHACTRLWGTCPLLSKRRGSSLMTISPPTSPFQDNYPPHSRETSGGSTRSDPLPARPPTVHRPAIPRVLTRKQPISSASLGGAALVESPTAEHARLSLDSSPSEASLGDLRPGPPRPRANTAVRFLDVVRSAAEQAAGGSAHKAEGSNGTASTLAEEAGAVAQPAPRPPGPSRAPPSLRDFLKPSLSRTVTRIDSPTLGAPTVSRLDRRQAAPLTPPGILPPPLPPTRLATLLRVALLRQTGAGVKMPRTCSKRRMSKGKR
ncbi:hypothetical protein PsYK624_048730 [Phanerochaete sordida]|uniref:DUF6535 domain-containing protein n=1 Tax=Phanerochaete sordida TaxID=48140 RepID=A0A9P3G5V0_9APHY|nr:hypothetical protein PsYK624_048730 [Phanerochaete sordida]